MFVHEIRKLFLNIIGFNKKLFTIKIEDKRPESLVNFKVPRTAIVNPMLTRPRSSDLILKLSEIKIIDLR